MPCDCLQKNHKTNFSSCLGLVIEMRNLAADWERTTVFNFLTTNVLPVSRVSWENPITF